MLFPPSSFPESPRLETKKALILVDFQADFVSSSGKLCVNNVSTFISKLPDLVSCFRPQGQIVWTSTEYRGPRPAFSLETGGFTILPKQFVQLMDKEVSSHLDTASVDGAFCEKANGAAFAPKPDCEAILAEVLPDGTPRSCVPGSAGADIAEPLASLIDRNKDIVVCKSDYSAFADMSLMFQLRTHMITQLYICGSLSNISVYATALDAVRHGFSVTVIEDCLGYRDEPCHIAAMQQMADNMGVEGTDYQELMDELAGLLGDVVPENTFTTQFQVNLSTTKSQTKSEGDGFGPHATNASANNTPPLRPKSGERVGSTSNASTIPKYQSLQASDSLDNKGFRERSSTLESSPPRKRSTDEVDDLEEHQFTKIPPLTSYRRQSYEIHAQSGAREKKPKVRVRRRDISETSTKSRPSPLIQSKSESSIPDPPRSPLIERQHTTTMAAESQPEFHTSRKMAKKLAQATLGPGDVIGDGSSSVIYNILNEKNAKNAFDTLRANVKWQKMYHRTGEVPRLVAVQGDVITSLTDQSKSYPIYRHPSDESPELLPFDNAVDDLRRECEKHVGHPLNHVLIQHYRTSEDNISEHSDKTLDIVRNSSIVNLSLGAQRTMTLRTKKVDAIEARRQPPDATDDTKPTTKSDGTALSPQISTPGGVRTAQRIPLPSGSLFVLSTATNAKYLQSIRADRRPNAEKSEAERAFNSERISLTFRHIGTFITESHNGTQTIWGQGATGKTKVTAKPVLQPTTIEVGAKRTPTDPNTKTKGDTNNTANNNTPIAASIQDDVENPTQKPTSPSPPSPSEEPPKSEADTQAKTMLIGFGIENHESHTFDWDAVYGTGFDVVNFVTKPVTKANTADLSQDTK